MYHQRLADSDHTLLRSWDRALEHQEIVLHDTVVGETTKWGDRLMGGIGIGGAIVGVGTRTNAVDLLVELRTVVVTIFTQPLASKPRPDSACTHFDQHAQPRT